MKGTAHQQRTQHRHQRYRQEGRPQTREGLRERQGSEEFPFLTSQHEHRKKGQDDDGHREEDRSPHLTGRRQRALQRLRRRQSKGTIRAGSALALLVLRAFAVPDDVLRHNDPGIHQHSDRDRNSRQRHDVRRNAELIHQDEGDENRERQRDRDDQDAAEVKQEQNVGEGHEDHLLDQRVLEGGHGPFDQIAAIVKRAHLNSRRQTRRHLFQPFLHLLNHRHRILAGPHDHHPTDHFPTVHIQRAASVVSAQFDSRDLPQIHRRSVHHLHRHVLQIGGALHQSHPAHDKLHAIFINGLPAHVEVGLIHRGQDVRQRDTQFPHAQGTHLHLILPDEAAQARHLRHAGNGVQLIAQHPILQGTQLTQIVSALRRLPGIDLQVVLIHPAQAGGIGSQLRRHTSGHQLTQIVQSLQNPGPREVVVGLVGEHHGDQREAEHGRRPN